MTLAIRYRLIPAITGLLGPIVLAGCQSWTTPFDGAASMRVEVEVYRGPISKEPETQWAELLGTITEVADAFEIFQANLKVEEVNPPSPKQQEAGIAEVYSHPSLALLSHDIDALQVVLCDLAKEGFSLNRQVYPGAALDRPSSSFTIYPYGSGASIVRNSCAELSKPDRAPLQASAAGRARTDPATLGEARRRIEEHLMSAATVAQQMRGKALLWSESHVGHPFAKRDHRTHIVTYSTILATYADRIGLRADTLLKQLRGSDRRELPLSIALRETQSPAFLKQYLWNDAARPPLMPSEEFDNLNKSARDRIRAIENLFADENWANINTVYASGQGVVRMALIKDDIGNWNLKSFDNDPTELLQAYKGAVLAGVKKATDLISSAMTGGVPSVAREALNMTNRLAFGGTEASGPTLGSKSLDDLHRDTSTRLRALAAGVAAKRKTLTDAANTARATLAPAQSASAQADSAYQKAVQDLAEKQRLTAEAKAAAQSAAALKLRADNPALSDAARKELGDAAGQEQQRSDTATQAADNLTVTPAQIAELEVRRDRALVEFRALEDKAKAADAELAAHARTTIQEARTILDNHEAVVDALQRAAVAKRQQSEIPIADRIPHLRTN